MPPKFYFSDNFNSHLSQMFTSKPSLNLNLGAGPGSVSYKKGTAKFKKAFFIWSSSHPFTTLINSIVYKPAIAAVVVARAGMIRPAFNLTLTQSIWSNL